MPFASTFKVLAKRMLECLRILWGWVHHQESAAQDEGAYDIWKYDMTSKAHAEVPQNDCGTEASSVGLASVPAESGYHLWYEITRLQDFILLL